MSELIGVHLGCCGVQLGLQFWQRLGYEHGLRGGLRENIGVSDLRIKSYYNEVFPGIYYPRAVFIDLDYGFVNSDIFRPENCLFGKFSAGNSWPKGMYTEGPEIIDEALNIIRKEAENCESLEGFQLFHSLGGGTGSGLGSLLSLYLKEEYPKCLLNSYSVFPSKEVSDSVIEPYNAILSINYLIEYMDSVTVIDNAALNNMCNRHLSLGNPKYKDFNYLASLALSGASCFYRFPSEGVDSLSKLIVNLVPEPRLHFLTLGLAPIILRDPIIYNIPSINYLLNQAHSFSSAFYQYNASIIRKKIASVAVFRGKISLEEAYNSVYDQKNINSGCLTWYFENIKTSVCKVPLNGMNQSCTLVSNTPEIADMFERILVEFSKMFKSKMFLYSYCKDGLDEMEIFEAELNCKELSYEYKDYFDSFDELGNY